MANPLFANQFQQAYLGTSDVENSVLNEGIFSTDASNDTSAYMASKPNYNNSIYNYDIGPNVYKDPSRNYSLRTNTDEYLKGLFQPAQTTEDYVAANPLTEGINIPDSSGVVGRPQAENTAQAAKRQSNYIQEAHDAVMDLMKGGKAIPAARGSALESAFRPQQYSNIERDIRGNIIGASGRMQIDPYTGAPIGKIAPDWKADLGGLGKPYTPGLDAFKQAQTESAITSAQAASTPAALQSQANRQAYIQSKISDLPKGATATQVETPSGIQRAVSGPSGYAQAMITKKKPQKATA